MPERDRICRPIIRIGSFMSEIIRHYSEITVKSADLFICQKRYLKQIDPIILYKRFQPVRNVKHMMQCAVLPPVFISKIQHQRDYRISFSPFLQQFRTVCGSIITDHPQRHVFIIACLILYAKHSNPHINRFSGSAAPILGHIPFHLVNPSVRFIHGHWARFCERLFRNDLLAPEQKPVNNIRKHIVVSFQSLLCHVFLSQCFSSFNFNLKEEYHEMKVQSIYI